MGRITGQVNSYAEAVVTQEPLEAHISSGEINKDDMFQVRMNISTKLKQGGLFSQVLWALGRSYEYHNFSGAIQMDSLWKKRKEKKKEGRTIG